MFWIIPSILAIMLFILVDSKDVRERLCCILYNGCYHVGVYTSVMLAHKSPCYTHQQPTGDIPTASNANLSTEVEGYVLPLHRINQFNHGTPVKVNNKHQVFFIIIEKQGYLFAAYMYNLQPCVTVTKDAQRSWEELSRYLSQFGMIEPHWETLLLEYYDRHELDLFEGEPITPVEEWFQNHNICVSDARSWKRLTRLCLLFAKLELEVSSPKQKACHLSLREQLKEFNFNLYSKREIFEMIEMHSLMVIHLKKDRKLLNKHIGIYNDAEKNLYKKLLKHVKENSLNQGKKKDINTQPCLTKITNKDGSSRYDKGHYAKKSCFICRGFELKYRLTCYQCNKCGMPLCNPSTVGVRKFHEVTCLQQHITSCYSIEQCDGSYKSNALYPKWLRNLRMNKIID